MLKSTLLARTNRFTLSLHATSSRNASTKKLKKAALDSFGGKPLVKINSWVKAMSDEGPEEDCDEVDGMRQYHMPTKERYLVAFKFVKGGEKRLSKKRNEPDGETEHEIWIGMSDATKVLANVARISLPIDEIHKPVEDEMAKAEEAVDKWDDKESIEAEIKQQKYTDRFDNLRAIHTELETHAASNFGEFKEAFLNKKLQDFKDAHEISGIPEVGSEIVD
jgi:hypothetical protein